MGPRSFDGRIYFRLLAAVSAADGQVHRTEVDRFRKLLELAEADPEMAPSLCTEALDHRADPLWFLTGEPVDRELARLCLRDALVLAAVDGWSAAEERALIVEAARRMGHPDLVADLPAVDAADPRQDTDQVPLDPGGAAEAATAEVERGLAAASTPPPTHREGFQPSLYFRLLAAVVAADEEVREDEVRRFEDLLLLFGADPGYARPLCREAMLRRADPLWFLRDAGPVHPAFAERLLREATLVAQADGHLGETEVAMLREAARLIGAPQPALPDPDDAPSAPPPLDEAADVAAETAKLDKALTLATGAGVAAGGAWVLVGGVAGKLGAGLAGALSGATGAWLVPLVLVIGATAASALIPVLRQLSPDDEA